MRGTRVDDLTSTPFSRQGQGLDNRQLDMEHETSRKRRRRGKIFICYRREGGADLARLVRDSLQHRGYDVFMDVENLRSGPFNTALFHEIETATDVVVILTPGSLDRCHNAGDWVRLEIARAIQQKRNIIPLMARGFDWPTPSAPLPADLAALPTYNGVSPSHEYFEASLDKLAQLLTGLPRRSRTWSYAIAAALVLAVAGGIAVTFAPQLRRVALHSNPTARQTSAPAPAAAPTAPAASPPKPVETPPAQSSELASLPVAGYRLVWADEFNGSALDTTKWDYHRWGAQADVGLAEDAVTVAGGFLTITSYTVDGRHFTCTISTRGKFERSFGYYEARIKFQDSPGVASAFWINSDSIGNMIDDPAVIGTEMDICEHRATDKSGKDIANKTHQLVYWGGSGDQKNQKMQLTDDLDLANGFHLYGLEWTKDGYRFFVDNKLTWTPVTPVSERPEYIILSSHIYDSQLHGTDWAGRRPASGYGSRESSTTKMVVDYVRFYERADAGVSAPQAQSSVASSVAVLPPERLPTSKPSIPALPALVRGRLGAERESNLRKYGGDEASEKAVLTALQWLKENQLANGAWELGNREEAGAAFGALALLGHGEGSDSPEFGRTVQKALQYLASRVGTNGLVGEGVMYEQGLVTLALADGLALTQSPGLRAPLERAVGVILQAQKVPKKGASGICWRKRLGPRSVEA